MNKHNTWILLTLLLILSSDPGFTQDKVLTLGDICNMNPNIFPARLKQLSWMGNSNSFTYVADNKLVKGMAGRMDTDTIVTLDDLNAGLSDLKLDSVKRFPSINYVSDFKFRFTHSKKILIYDITSRSLIVGN
ncbi:MAG: hypothetical protein K8R53_04650 [Bacteroidales bacterium]|nr:hypothetical protein [Bacteroidales bacterium]